MLRTFLTWKLEIHLTCHFTRTEKIKQADTEINRLHKSLTTLTGKLSSDPGVPDPEWYMCNFLEPW